MMQDRNNRRFDEEYDSREFPHRFLIGRLHRAAWGRVLGTIIGIILFYILFNDLSYDLLGIVFIPYIIVVFLIVNYVPGLLRKLFRGDTAAPRPQPNRKEGP